MKKLILLIGIVLLVSVVTAITLNSKQEAINKFNDIRENRITELDNLIIPNVIISEKICELKYKIIGGNISKDYDIKCHRTYILNGDDFNIILPEITTLTEDTFIIYAEVRETIINDLPKETVKWVVGGSN